MCGQCLGRMGRDMGGSDLSGHAWAVDGLSSTDYEVSWAGDGLLLWAWESQFLHYMITRWIHCYSTLCEKWHEILGDGTIF